MLKIITLLALISTSVFAQTTQNPGMPLTPTPAPEAQLQQTSPAVPECPPQKCPECPSCDRGKTEVYRADSFGTLMVGYQYANNWVPRKTTGSYTQIFNRDWSLEFEYATSERNVTIAGTDLGKMEEQRYTLFAKYYVGNSFYVSFGPVMSQIKIDPAGVFQGSGGETPKDLELENYGLGAAFGSRWQNKWGLTWGVDWFRVNVPIRDGKVQKRKADLDGDGQTDVSRSFSALRTIPTFTFMGVNIGWTF